MNGLVSMAVVYTGGCHATHLVSGQLYCVLDLLFHRCQQIVSKFMELDLDRDDIAAFFKDVVLPAAESVL